MKPQLVLSDDLLKLYLDFGANCSEIGDLTRLQKLFSYYKPHLSNEAQYNRIGKEMSKELKATLLKNGISPNFSLEELSQRTSLKIILCEDDCRFPYVKIDGTDKLQLCYTGTFVGEHREKCIDHLRALCKNATSVLLYDKYLYSTDRTEEDNVNLLLKILELLNETQTQTLSVYDTKPSKKMELENIAKKCKKTFPSKTIKIISSSDFHERHDRYMIIKSNIGNVEVLLSSGFDNLFKNTKDFTYLIRLV